MGGFINITIRKSNGNICNLEKYTNSIPSFVDNDKFYEEDEKHLKKFCSLEDYTNLLIPKDYGLIVLDYQTKTILSNQGYTHIGSIDFIQIKLELQTQKNFPTHLKNNSFDTLVRLIDKKIITTYSDRLNPDKKPTEINTTENLKEILHTENDKFNSFNISYPGWNIIHFEENSKGFNNMLQHIKDLDFTLTQEEETIWYNWITDMKEEEILEDTL